nr:unnamed protein product [Callosobruchus chinensis]
MGALTLALSTRLTDGIGSLIRNISVPTHLRQLTVDPLNCIDKQYKVMNGRCSHARGGGDIARSNMVFRQ